MPVKVHPGMQTEQQFAHGDPRRRSGANVPVKAHPEMHVEETFAMVVRTCLHAQADTGVGGVKWRPVAPLQPLPGGTHRVAANHE